MWTLILIILGEFDFESLQQANQALGPLLFITFVLFVFFILVNMFIAILGEEHESVSEGSGRARRVHPHDAPRLAPPPRRPPPPEEQGRG